MKKIKPLLFTLILLFVGFGKSIADRALYTVYADGKLLIIDCRSISGNCLDDVIITPKGDSDQNDGIK